MVDTAIFGLLEELKDVLKLYTDLLSVPENEFQRLNDDLNFMKAFLRDAGDRLKTNETFKEIERQIREVVYDVQDTIDMFLTAAASKSNTLILHRLRKSILVKRVRILREGKVTPLLEKVKTGFAALGGASTSAEQPPSRSRNAHFIRQVKVVGFEDEAEKVIGYLMEEKEELDVISIIGMPGLGKTTLACKIFENEYICYHFSVRIWVYVSQRLNSRDVFLNILKMFTSHDMSGLSDDELAQSVRKHLCNEKYLLVLDDVWSPEDWNIIKNVLPSGNRSSKVMITSSHQSVGVHAKVSTDPHMLRFLRPDESWKLLQLEVFRNEEDCPQEFVTIGTEIARQCYGVPLAVLVVGDILVDLLVKTRVPCLLRKEWDNVSENLSKYMQKEMVRHMSERLNYNQLPSYLRECFLYMGVFPEDQTIPARMLTRLWIAEGFVRPYDGSSLEEAAEEILGDLVCRNLLMVDQTNPMGEIKTCRVHIMIRGFCREMALEQNLFQEIRENKHGVLEPPVSEVRNFRRLCFRSNLNKLFSAKPNGPRVRSFLCLHKEPVNVDVRYISTIPEAFTLLRVLESMSIRFHQFPAKVTKLIHLRYVTLQIEALTVLPESLSRLWNLQTLVIETKSRTIKMKANIWKMYQLRHLKTKAAIILDPKWDGKGGDNLQTLSRLAPESCTAELSRRACNLKELGIRGNLATHFSTMSMENLCLLEKLKLMNNTLADFAHHLIGFPQRKCFPPKLKRLTLSNTFLEWKHISTLSEISTLEVLKLKDNAFVGIYWDARKVSFTSLHFLLILNTDLVHWEASTNSFPRLSCLVVKNCENLIEIPGALAEALEKLEIEHVRKSAVESALRIEAGNRMAQELEKSKLKLPFKLSIGPGCSILSETKSSKKC